MSELSFISKTSNVVGNGDQRFASSVNGARVWFHVAAHLQFPLYPCYPMLTVSVAAVKESVQVFQVCRPLGYWRLVELLRVQIFSRVLVRV